MMNAATLAIESDGGPGVLVFEDLVSRYQGSLFQFALNLTRCEADAWDLTQQTFYTLATKGHQLRDAAKAKTWMFTTLHRAFLQICRKQTRFPQVNIEEVNGDLPSIPAETLDHLDAAQVLNALDQIDEAFRAPVALFYLKDLSYKEIAETLNIPIGTVKSRIARGIVQLRRILTAALASESAV